MGDHMDLTTFHTHLAQPNARGYALNDEQIEAVNYASGPLWLLAGPGSGKSEVLVTRTLKLLCVDPQVKPRSIFLTTFTTKAARNLEDRLATYLLALQNADPALQTVDLSDLRIGTLHSLCNDILQEYRFPAYQNIRLLDEVEQHLFVYRQADIAEHTELAFWQHFAYAVPEWGAGGRYEPSKWKRVKAAVILFNHLVEDMVDLQTMEAQGGHWLTLAAFYKQYVQALHEWHRCDFAHLQAHFLAFLNAPASTVFMDGDGQQRPPLMHVLVDEYQDTNPIQERIYLALARNKPHNLTVVGDDDQALYRFRGGNVACMVNFDQACMTTFGFPPHKIQLEKNYRSHRKIVDFFNSYITSFPAMTKPNVRAPGKKELTAEANINGDYPAVAWMSGRSSEDVYSNLAQLVANHLLGDKIIDDLSQCVLLLRSTKDSPRNAGPYLSAFEQAQIPVYNPRSKSFMESEEVQCLLAVLVKIIDMNQTFESNWSKDLKKDIPTWFATLTQFLANQSDLNGYIQQSHMSLVSQYQTNAGTSLNLSLHEILFRILSLEPFRTWRRDPLRNARLAKVTRLFESYHSFGLDKLVVDSAGTALAPHFLNTFYNMFVTYLIEAGISDDEDEEVIVPKGYLPIMTIHQSKGLEFPFVIVGQLANKGRVGAAQHLEHDLAPFRTDLYQKTSSPVELLALEDDIRLLYVAYSRAQYGLILAGTLKQIGKHVAAPGRDTTAFQRTIRTIFN